MYVVLKKYLVIIRQIEGVKCMKLNEIELDLPYQKNIEFIHELQNCKNMGYSEAIKQDYEVNWKEMRRKFQLMTRCMTSMIERIMKPIYTKTCWKILIECVDKYSEKTYRNLLGVYTIQMGFNRECFFSASNFEKKRMVIDIVLEAMRRFSDYVDFEVDNINAACFEIIKKDYENEWFWKNSCFNRKKEAKIKIIHDVNDVKLYVVFLENDIFIDEKLLLCADSDEWSYSLFLGDFRWTSDDEVALITKSGEIYICNNSK